MQYLVSLDPGLDLSASEFVEAWNRSAYVTTGRASLEQGEAKAFLPPDVLVALISAAEIIPSTIIATFVSDYLCKKFFKKKEPSITVKTIHLPDSRPVFIIKQEENM
ncbi:MAG: hypothetical protein HGB35_00805 [Geobacteraceae bacterium]|nr:hypothetical protein [Geobacteraceae bacterium]